MHSFYGIWIDHSNATLIKSNALAEMTFEHFQSDVESHNHGGESEEHLSVTNQHRHEERRHNQLKAFCREILKHVTNPDELVIFGPSTAKHSLKHEIEEHTVLASKLKGIETTDKLTEAELKEFMQTYFKLPLA